MPTFSRGRGRGVPSDSHMPPIFTPSSPDETAKGPTAGRAPHASTAARQVGPHRPPAPAPPYLRPCGETTDRGGRSQRARGTCAKSLRPHWSRAPFPPPLASSAPFLQRGGALSPSAAYRVRSWPHWLSRTRARRVRSTSPERSIATRARIFVYVGRPERRRTIRQRQPDAREASTRKRRRCITSLGSETPPRQLDKTMGASRARVWVVWVAGRQC